MESYLTSVIKQFERYKSLGDKTLEQLTFDDLQNEIAKDSNSIAIMVKHLYGNMLSRWTNFLDEDGEKPSRNRDREFDDTYETREQILAHWNAGWTCLFDALNNLTSEDLERIIYIRNERHTVVEAINRQLAHYAYHVGQMVFLGKVFKGNDWQTLSIARGASKKYNAEKFSEEKN
ncbi:DUF1572 family protein [Algibacter miyuki]|uniref:DUF1572 family protein n=1 Tax=Algibacter miyuki TaxID=1306933 RepID=A0ABV5H0M5_9FLAO|nr:DUF1572 family protein [Algibacter miyuki]MDN3664151.1 DUF1572 family protein [Algibacter miyuki]